MKLIVGLGNPGRDYAETRHNVGFMVADRAAADHRAAWKRDGFGAFACYAEWSQGRVKLLKPETMMNLSGQAVLAAVRRWKVEPADVLVVSDEVYLPLGSMRLKPAGGAGGHNGLASCLEALGTEQIPRLRIGVGREPLPKDLSTFVLAEFEHAERPPLSSVVERAVETCERWIARGLGAAMNHANADPGTASAKEE